MYLYLYRKYTIARKTNALKIPYYVKDNFHTEYQGSVGRLDTSVEEEYLNTLKHACYRERNYSNYFEFKCTVYPTNLFYLQKIRC